MGICNKEYFINKISNNGNSKEFDKKDYIFRDVDKDGNCGYRALAVQLYCNENYFSNIRDNVYNYINLNKEQYKNLNLYFLVNLLQLINMLKK